MLHPPRTSGEITTEAGEFRPFSFGPALAAGRVCPVSVIVAVCRFDEHSDPARGRGGGKGRKTAPCDV